MGGMRRVQLHVPLPYKKDPSHDPRVARLLTEGWSVEEIQRLSDKDALITLAPPEPAPAP